MSEPVKIITALFISALICGSAWAGLQIQFGGFPNYGWEFGYYGDYNRVGNVIKSMPELRIVKTYCHRDVSIEDFSYTVKDASGNIMVIDWHEGQDAHWQRSKFTIRRHIAEKTGVRQ